MKKAVIACQVFYSEIAELARNSDIDVELLPQGLHNLVDSAKMQNVIQQKIDELEKQDDYDYIILAYGYCSGGVEGLTAQKASLVIGLVHDCIPLLMGNQNIGDSVDDGATYYLSRGWIDCGGDSYTEYLCLIDKIDTWVEKFSAFGAEEANQAVVMWHDKIRSNQNRRKYSQDIAEMITYELIKNYRSITLIDNNNLKEIHHEYTTEMHSFLNELLTKNRGEGLDLRIVQGNPGMLEKLLFFDQLPVEEQQQLFLITNPGEPLKMSKILLKT